MTDKAIEALFPQKVFDQNAYTVHELVEHSGLSHSQTEKKVRRAVESGEWEQVWKRTEFRPVKAYRPKK